MSDGTGNQAAIPLAEVDEIGAYRVVGVSGSDPQRRRLNEMGFMPGMSFMVTACPAEGMLVIKLAGRSMALSPGTTAQVMVRRRGP